MGALRHATCGWLIALLGLAAPVSAQNSEGDKPTEKPASGAPSEADMQMMMEMMEKQRAVTEHHKRLDFLLGEWEYVHRIWMAPDAPPMESTGTTSTKALLDGRFYVTDHKGTFFGKPFVGVCTTGFDSRKQKYVGTWIDNFGTAIIPFDGSYDAEKKVFTYHLTLDDPMTQTSLPVIQRYRVIDADAHVMEWYEVRDGKEMRTMEIAYKRKKS